MRCLGKKIVFISRGKQWEAECRILGFAVLGVIEMPVRLVFVFFFVCLCPFRFCEYDIMFGLRFSEPSNDINSK